MHENFTYSEYSHLLQVLQSGRENLRFSDFSARDNIFKSSSDYFILRHDIDFSLEAALAMAQMEAKIGIRASYFLLLSCDHYNLLSEEFCEFPRKLISLGHEVGLHYDVRAMGARGSDMNDELQFETHVLTRLAGESVRSIAMHNPSVYGDDPFATTQLFVNAYAREFTKEIAYYSDSCGAWRNETHKAFTERRLPKKLQLLIHPIFWSDESGNRWLRLNDWADGCFNRITEQKHWVKREWQEHSGVREHDERLRHST